MILSKNRICVAGVIAACLIGSAAMAQDATGTTDTYGTGTTGTTDTYGTTGTDTTGGYANGATDGYRGGLPATGAESAAPVIAGLLLTGAGLALRRVRTQKG